MTAPAVRRFRGAVGLLLAGPAIWLAHFATVYLVSEAACTGGAARLVDVPLVATVTVGATVVALPAALLVARSAWRSRRGEGHELRFVAFLLALLFSVAVLLQAVPPLVLEPC